MRLRRAQGGLVLIFALWVLGILTILAVSVAAGIRQKIFLVGRLDDRSRMNYLLEASVKKTAAYIHQQMEECSFVLTPATKMNLFNNSNELSSILLRQDQAGVGYVYDSSVRWGVVDEESKINLNRTKTLTLTNLLISVLSLKDEDAAKLALAIQDWHQTGEAEITGFYSEDYYSNLQYPYPKKSADYETLDELLLVNGVNKQMYDKLIDFVTIYGDGGVNINTASKQVLMALGLPDTLVDKILTVRRGKDSIEGTTDDHLFVQPYEIASEINAIVPLQLAEVQAIDSLTMTGLLTTQSFYFTIEATGKLSSGAAPRKARAVYSAREDKILYWKER